jgi:hypothetical protein
VDASPPPPPIAAAHRSLHSCEIFKNSHIGCRDHPPPPPSKKSVFQKSFPSFFSFLFFASLSSKTKKTMARLEGWKAGVFVGLLLYVLSLRGAESGAATTALSSLSVSGDLLPRCAVAIGGGARPPRCANDPLVALVAALPTADPGIVFRAERGRRLVIEDGVRGAAVAVVDNDDDYAVVVVVVVVVVFGREVFFFPLRIAWVVL